MEAVNDSLCCFQKTYLLPLYFSSTDTQVQQRVCENLKTSLQNTTIPSVGTGTQHTTIAKDRTWCSQLEEIPDVMIMDQSLNRFSRITADHWACLASCKPDEDTKYQSSWDMIRLIVQTRAKLSLHSA